MSDIDDAGAKPVRRKTDAERRESRHEPSPGALRAATAILNRDVKDDRPGDLSGTLAEIIHRETRVERDKLAAALRVIVKRTDAPLPLSPSPPFICKRINEEARAALREAGEE